MNPRAEFFNVTNRVNFRNPSGAIFSSGPSTAPPSGMVSTGTAGVLNLTNTSSRQIQFGLKLLF